MMSHACRMKASKTPWVDGYVIMSAASVSLCSAALARRSPRSMLPLASACTGTTRSPAITALAGFVPCADVGIKQVVRCPSPRSEEHTSELQSLTNLVCRLLLEKKKKNTKKKYI